MKRSPTNSSCSSSSSSSCLESDAVVPDHHHHDNHHQSVKPTKIKRPRKNQTKEKCQNANTSTTTTTTANLSGRRSSIYRGVTRHRWTGRFEAHLWDKSSWNNIQNKKGRQVYLGAYDCEEAAARTYDLAALKYWGPETTLNFPIETYKKELEEMQKVSKEEYLASLRRRSSGFSRGVSKYRGVARHHHNGRWEARIGRVFGNKYLYLGTYNTQEEAAAAYDMAAIEYRGANAVTNFDISHYIDQLKKKGIIPHQDQLPNSSTDQSEETEAEPEVEQPQSQPPQPPPQQPPEQPLLPPQQVLYDDQYSHLPPSIDTTCCTMVNVMDIPNEDDQDLTWSFCLDNAGLNPFPVPDFPLGNACDQLPNLFDDTGFEDNIDFMFDTMEFCGVEVGVEEMNNSENEKERLLLLSSSSSSSASFSLSSSSTTTSISCNY